MSGYGIDDVLGGPLRSILDSHGIYHRVDEKAGVLVTPDEYQYYAVRVSPAGKVDVTGEASEIARLTREHRNALRQQHAKDENYRKVLEHLDECFRFLAGFPARDLPTAEQRRIVALVHGVGPFLAGIRGKAWR